MNNTRTLIFDLDDTVLRCNEYYSNRRTEFVQRMLEIEGIEDIDKVDDLLQQTQLELKRQHGYTRKRFPQSMVETYRRLMSELGRQPDPEVAREVFKLGDSVFDAPYKPYPGALDMLVHYHEANFQLGLFTKGDPEIQWMKIQRYNLDHLFDAIEIIEDEKQPHQLQKLEQQIRNGSPEPGVMVGNSLRDDVRVGRAAGLGAVWVRSSEVSRQNRFVAALEEEADTVQPDAVIEHLRDLKDVIPPRTRHAQRSP